MTTLSPCAKRNDLDMYASSVSSVELSPPPPRPDSPSLFLADSAALMRARLRQLQVWGDAAEEERDDREEDTPAPSHPPPSIQTPRGRLADRTRPPSYNFGSDFGPGPSRRKSLFCGRPLSDRQEMTRKPSLWSFAGLTRASSMSLSSASCGRESRRMSFRRRGSFHRYTRVSGDVKLPDRGDRSSFAGSDFDDLSEGLNATKVTETAVARQ